MRWIATTSQWADTGKNNATGQTKNKIKKTNLTSLDIISIHRELYNLKKSGIEKAILTNMHVDLDYETVMNETPKNVEPAFDGMVLDFAFSN